MSAISYIVEVIICSGLFLVFYRWMIAKKVGFRLCRIYLTVTMLLSAVIPAMNVPVYTAAHGTSVTTLTEIFLDGYSDLPAADETTIEAATAETSSTDIATKSNERYFREAASAVLTAIYIMVASAGLGLIAYNTVRIGRMRRRSKLTHTEDYTLAEHEEIRTPFSFLRTIFMGFNYEPHERRQILAHEASHVRHRHSYERLVLSALRAIYWFNPFFRMAEKDLEEVQEWEADKDVLNEGHELRLYRTTIFKQLFGYNPDISCGLNHSLTKQRFIMMTQSRRGKGAWIRLAATLPIITGLFFAFGCGTRSQEKSAETAVLTPDGQEQLTFRIHVAKSKDEKGTYSIFCNDILTDIETISKTVSEYFAGEDMVNTTVSISADENVPMGIITDIKEQLRDARALKVRYETTESAIEGSAIEKRLPPALQADSPVVVTDALSNVNRRNIIVVRVNPKGEMFMGSTFVKGSLHNEVFYRKEIERLKGIIANPADDTKNPEIELKEIQLPDGVTKQFRTSKGMVSFQCDRGTSYEDYTQAMTLITTAYKELREELSAEVFNKPLADLSDAEMQVIYQAVPMNVSEAEPKDVPARK